MARQNAQSTTSSSSSTSSTQAKKRVTIDITKRSPWMRHRGEAGSKSYLDYALPASYFFPTYGAGDNGFVPGRYPLPDRFYLPGY